MKSETYIVTGVQRQSCREILASSLVCVLYELQNSFVCTAVFRPSVCEEVLATKRFDEC